MRAAEEALAEAGAAGAEEAGDAATAADAAARVAADAAVAAAVEAHVQWWRQRRRKRALVLERAEGEGLARAKVLRILDELEA